MDIFLSRTDTGQARWWNAETFAVPIYSPAGSWSSRSSSTKATERKKKLRRQGGLAETREIPSGPGGVGKGAVPRWRPAAKAKKKPRAEDGDDARRAGLQEKLARLRRRLLGTEEGKEEKVIDVEEDGDVAAEEQELDSVEEVGRLPTTALTRETMESPRRAGRREKRQKEKDNGKAKALVKLLEGKQEKKKKKEKKCTKKKKRVKKESPSGDSCPGSSGPSSPAQRCWHLSKSARQRGRAQS